VPIRPENRDRYPRDWPEISRRVRARANWQCEGSPAFPDCRAWNGEPHPETGSIVVLTVAHLDRTPENCSDENLRAMCQRCHLTYDGKQHAQNRIRDRHDAADTQELFADDQLQERPPE
jgi:hypothetical protein